MAGVGDMTKLANDELARVESSMKPQMDKLRAQVTSTELVDDAREDAAVQAAGAQAAVQRSRSAGGATGTTRQQALANYQAKQDAKKAQVGAVNTARVSQSAINEDAQDKLAGMTADLAKTSMSARMDAAKADQDYNIAQENLKTQKKNAKKQFWGNLGGTALGIGAALLL
jgi:hypothetical protein